MVLSPYYTKTQIDIKVSEMTNDVGAIMSKINGDQTDSVDGGVGTNTHPHNCISI